MVSRRELAEELRRWAAGARTAAEVQAFAEAARHERASAPPPADRDPVLDEALGDLDLLAVHLLCPDDAPALLALLEGDGDPADPAAPTSIARWRRHRLAIDLDERSRRLRRDPLYRPFCR